LLNNKTKLTFFNLPNNKPKANKPKVDNWSLLICQIIEHKSKAKPYQFFEQQNQANISQFTKQKVQSQQSIFVNLPNNRTQNQSKTF
jgi:hypothetical protein